MSIDPKDPKNFLTNPLLGVDVGMMGHTAHIGLRQGAEKAKVVLPPEWRKRGKLRKRKGK